MSQELETTYPTRDTALDAKAIDRSRRFPPRFNTSPCDACGRSDASARLWICTWRYTPYSDLTLEYVLKTPVAPDFHATCHWFCRQCLFKRRVGRAASGTLLVVLGIPYVLSLLFGIIFLLDAAFLKHRVGERHIPVILAVGGFALFVVLHFAIRYARRLGKELSPIVQLSDEHFTMRNMDEITVSELRRLVGEQPTLFRLGDAAAG